MTLPSKSPNSLSELVGQYTHAQLPVRQPGEPVYPPELAHLEEIYRRNQQRLAATSSIEIGGPGKS